MRPLAVALISLALTLTGCGQNAFMSGPSVSSAPQVAAGWTLSRVTPDGVRAVEPSLLERQAGGFAIAYSTSTLGNQHVFVTTSSDGSHWGTPVSVAPGPLTDESPALYEDAAGTLHCLFASNRSQRYRLYESTSQDGASWSEAAALPEDPDQSYRPSVATLTNGTLALVYETIGGALRFRTRSAQGTWSEASTIHAGGGDPALAALSDGRLMLAYRSYGKLQTRSRSASGTWSEASDLGLQGEAPSLSPDGQGGLWLVFAAEAGDTMKLTERRGDGKTWAAGAELTSGDTEDQDPAALVTRSGERVMTWGAVKDGRNQGLFFARRS
ncbi:MAG TPA: sialidase family protein [Stenomitos sp.]